ncbi:hypothetical protein D3W54_06950 [Komagataeibacter medellinensis]|nr:hypothetical protein D3W54_06950 [Komagataeibacter medellinensis]
MRGGNRSTSIFLRCEDLMIQLTDEEIDRLGLLPCPFCGSRAEIEWWHGGAPTKQMVSCGGNSNDELVCEVSPMVTGETPEEAAEHWNRRHTERSARV